MKPQNNPLPASHHFDPTILREYDIRGQIGKTLSEDDAFALGRAFGTFVKRKGGSRISVGYDGRHSSPALADALIKGLTACGIDVTAIGLGPSPMLYFAVKHGKEDAGVMVTGSHNPPDYNGFKMMLQTGPVYGAMIQEIGKIAAAGDFENGSGTARETDIQDTYIERLMKDYAGGRALNIAWDAGNGAAGAVLQRLAGKLPGTHTLLYEQIDGDFPNHHPDPTVDENLADLIQEVKSKNCDLGIAFDGDGDRIGVVDENGTVLRCDMLLALYAREVLEKHQGAAIIGDIKCSQVLFDEIARLGGKPVMWKTGHSLIKAKMAEEKSPLAGELSGHIFFADKYYGYDDALYCAVRLINLVAGLEDGGLSGLTRGMPALFSTPEVRFEVEESEKFGLLPRVIESLKAQGASSLHINDIDGVRVTTDDGWWLLRASNTQAVLVARAEGTSREGLDRLIEMASNEVGKLGYTLAF